MITECLLGLMIVLFLIQHCGFRRVKYSLDRKREDVIMFLRDAKTNNETISRLISENRQLSMEIALLNAVIITKNRALQHVVDSCVHPDTAVRAVMVDLEPIRKALELK